MGTTTVIKVRKSGHVRPAAAAGADAIRQGGLVGFPTETVYGIAALATDAEAMRRLRRLKERPDKPFTVHIGQAAAAARYVANPPGAARRLMARAWPGPVTLLLPTGGSLVDAALNRREIRAALCPNDVIGLRCPRESVAVAMLSAVDGPVVAPSANLAGRPSPRRASDVLADLDGRIDVLIDRGRTRHGKDSTIVAFDGPAWQVIRFGAMDAAKLRRAVRFRGVFVCTGNTCRSPIAAGLARSAAARELGCSVRALAEQAIELLSAGLIAGSGASATVEARQAAAELGADLKTHRSRKLTPELVKSADAIWCMTQAHVTRVLAMVPEAAEKTRRVDARVDIDDPIGGSLGVYRTTARRLQHAADNLLKEDVL